MKTITTLLEIDFNQAKSYVRKADGKLCEGVSADAPFEIVRAKGTIRGKGPRTIRGFQVQGDMIMRFEDGGEWCYFAVPMVDPRDPNISVFRERFEKVSS